MDTAFAVFGNDQALPWIRSRIETLRDAKRDGVPYQPQLTAARRTIDQLPANFWNANIYSRWLDTLRSLRFTYNDGRLPKPMRTRAWQMKNLNTQLASWTHLKHDTLLYTKQAYAGVTRQPDGKLVIGGQFATIGAVARNQIARLNPDGLVDPGFNPYIISCCALREANTVNAVAMQADKILVTGNKIMRASGSTYFLRLNPDGSQDTGFSSPTFEGPFSFLVGVRLQSVVQPDGKILVWGDFYGVTGANRVGIARLNADGTLDTAFDAKISSGGAVNALALQADGRILIGGTFTSVQGLTRQKIARLNSDGSLDATFDPGTGFVIPDDSPGVTATALRPDGGIIVGGSFSAYNGVARQGIAALKSDGALDSGFSAGSGPDSLIYAVITQPDGKALVGGAFTNFAGTVRPGLVRLQFSGALDPEFDTGTGVRGTLPRSATFENVTWVRSILIQANGAILVGGNFSSINDIPRKGLARLHRGGSMTAAGPVIVTQPQSRSLRAGEILTLMAVVSSASPVNYQWQREGANLPGATDSILTLKNVQVTDAGGYRLIAANAFGAVTSLVAVVTVMPSPARAGLPDLTFYADLVLGPPFPSANTLAVQSDGRILFRGRFGIISGRNHSGIARLLPNGDWDPEFNPGSGAGAGDLTPDVLTMALQADGKVLLGGYFSTMDGQPRASLARLNPNGSLDLAFNPQLVGGVNTLAVLPSRKILVAGSLHTVDRSSVNGIARLEENGQLDPSFGAGLRVALDGYLRSLAVQNDGKIVVGGSFSQFHGVPRNNLVRLQEDGGVDLTFAPMPGPDNSVAQVAVQSDGKVLLLGQFTQMNGVPRKRFARVNPDGTLDAGFDPAAKLTGPYPDLTAFAVQTDGRILLAGQFTAFDGLPRNRLVRLNRDGSLDLGFDPQAGPDSIINSIVPLADQTILLGGGFRTVDGLPRPFIARLHGRTRPSLSLPIREEGGVSLLVETAPAHTYTLQFADSVSTSNWTSLEVFGGDGSIKRLRDPNPAGPQRFYRLRVE